MDSPSSAAFASTQWSVVLAAQSHNPAALGVLCSRYWRPLYCYVRRRGYSVEDAQDLTQSYFARLLEKSFLEDVDSSHGKFRSFLLASMKHFLANEWDRVRAAKRGGALEFLNVDDIAGAEHQYARQSLADSSTPEQIYERSWAIAVLQHAMSRLQSEFSAAGKSRIFEALKIFLTGDGVKYAPIAESLGMTEGAVRVAVHRLRDRFRALLRTEIAQSLENPADARSVDQELRFLMTVL